MISIVIPTMNEEKYIAKCLESIIYSDTSIDDIEIIIVDGMSTDKTREIINKYVEKYPQILLLDNLNLTVPYAMNIGIKNARFDIIIRMDAHAVFPRDYISKLLYWQKKLKADNVGGIVETLPVENTLIAKAIALAMGSSFGVGNSYFRIGTKEPMEVDTVPFGCYKKKTLEEIGLYDEELTRNQDDELNARLIKNGGKIWLIPEIKIKYFPRQDFKSLFKMFYQYGYFKPLVNFKLKKAATFRQFVPPLFVLYLLIGLSLPFMNSMVITLYSEGLAIYFLASFYVSVKLVKKDKDPIKLWFFLIFSFFLIHIAYGCGYLLGILDFILPQKRRTEVSSSR